MSTTGNRIAELRKQRGLTQAKLAQEAGISTSAVAMYETNRRQLDESTTQQLAAALGVDVSFLRVTNEPVHDEVRIVKSASPQASHQQPVPPVDFGSDDDHQEVGKKPSTIAPGVKGTQAAHLAQRQVTKASDEHPDKSDPGWTSLALSRDEARFILFMRMNPDSLPFLQQFMNADPQKRKQIEKAWRLIHAFQA
ncbi:helix-turn-helix domain-containing protein [Alicyclobacillus dauci]|uniref:Helix-turn-helix domain-containing protein n=1 Tax=Alicyclobacillus dauci TaxID=1475485 RepID=A0ABY6Z534_9BACL|nr:helix-turn-helix transcriptional regulator [Alicyclobacillus dauci]WAH37922.1 helix-turn-helix domain-containing protein [Alicyclobacillus dauci]